MSPEVLIVGDASNQRSLIQAVRAARYEVTLCTAVELEGRMQQTPAPSLAILCLADVQVERVLSRLRRSRVGAAMPVVLYGTAEDGIRSPEEAMELGADHLLEAPASQAVLEAVLLELAGAPGAEEDVAEEASRPRSSTPEDLGKYADPPERAATISDEALLDAALEEQRGREGVEPDLEGQPDPEEFRLEPELEASTAAREKRPTEDEAASPAWRTGSSSASQPEPESGEPARHIDEGTTASRESDGELEASLGEALSRRCVPEVLWELHRDRYTGRVTVRRDSIRKDVWLLRGSPVFARSNDPEDRLIELLGRRSLIPAEKLETARTLVGRDDRRAGEVLVEAGFLKGEELSSMLSEHLVAMVWSVVGWVDGTIEVVEDDRVDEPTSIDTPMAPLLIEGLTYYTEREELERWIGPLSRRVALGPRLTAPGGLDQVATALSLGSVQLGWMRRFGGNDTVGTLAARAHDPQGLLALIYLLSLDGLVELTTVRADRRGQRSSEHIDEDRISARLRLVRDGNYFALLGLRADARPMDVRRAYFELSRTFEPASIDPTVRHRRADDLVELRAALHEAREVLTNDVLRSAYLAHFEPDPAATPATTPAMTADPDSEEADPGASGRGG